MKKIKEKSFLLALILILSLLAQITIGQSYLKKVNASDDYFNQQIARFSNGDILIGDSSLGPLRSNREDGKVFFARLDPCGNIVWAHSYSLLSGYLEFRDFSISSSEEVLAYGSHFNGVDEVLFLLEINGKTGKKAVFKLFDPKTANGFFAYSLQRDKDQFMIYGFLANPNVGLIAYFDANYNVVWAKKITPFEANGSAIVDQDHHVVAWSGNMLFRMTPQGEIAWGQVLNVSTVNGPIEVDKGYIWVGHREGLSFFYKTDVNGQLRWQSDLFPAIETSGAITLLANNNLLFTYNCPSENNNSLCQLILSPTGQVIEQRKLIIDQTINPGIITQSLDRFNWLTIAGNANSFVGNRAEIEDFILQFSLDELSNDCVTWENFRELNPNSINLEFNPLNLNAANFTLEKIENTSTEIDTFQYDLTDLCKESLAPSITRQDTTLACGEDWLVHLPENGFKWSDGSTQNPRLLNEPGTYNARKVDCDDPVELEFILNREDCGCPVFLPNAFSPNNDEINDQLVFYSSCQLEGLTLRVFNRFGSEVFYSDQKDQYWDGKHQQQDAPTGIYVVIVQYKWINQDGMVQDQRFYQDVTLIR